MRKGDAAGYIFGGVVASILLVFGVGAGNMPLPGSDSIARSHSPVAFYVAACAMVAISLGLIAYGVAGWRGLIADDQEARDTRDLAELAQSDDPPATFGRSIRAGLMRIAIAITATLIAVFAGGPICAVFLPHVAIRTIACVGCVVLFLGRCNGSYFFMLVGWIMMVMAGMAILIGE